MKKLLTIACLCAATAALADPTFLTKTVGSGITIDASADPIVFTAAAKPLVYVAGVDKTSELVASGDNWTLTKPSITEDTLVVAVVNETYDSPKPMWYENSVVTGKLSTSFNDVGSGFNSYLDAQNNYFVLSHGFGSTTDDGYYAERYVTTIAQLIDAGSAGATAIYSIVTPCDEALRGAGISTAYGVMVSGHVQVSGKMSVFGLDSATKLGTIQLYDTDGTTKVTPACFAFDGSTMWVNTYPNTASGVADQGYLYKYTIPAAGFVVDTEWTAVGKVYTGSSKAKYGFRMFKVNGTNYFYSKDDSNYWVGTETTAFVKYTGFGGSRYDDIAIAGDHIYLFTNTSKIISVYDLDATTGWVSGDAVETVSVSTFGSDGGSVFVTTDEKTMIYCSNTGAFVFQGTPLAPIQCGNEIGMLEIDSDKTEIVLSVPFSELATAENVCVSNIVKTAGLEENDKLYCYFPSTKKWEAWTLVDESGVKHWQSVGKAAIDPATGKPSTETVTASTDSTTVVPGGALWLSRQHGVNKIYVYGAAVSNVQSPLVAGVKNLIGNPTTNTVAFTTDHGYTPANGDAFIETPLAGAAEGTSGKRWVYKAAKTKWQNTYYDSSAKSYKAQYETDLSLAPGQGGWIIPATAQTITWTSAE